MEATLKIFAQRLESTFKLVIDEVAAKIAPAEAVAVFRLARVVEPRVEEAETVRFVPAILCPVKLVTVVEARVVEPVTARVEVAIIFPATVCPSKVVEASEAEVVADNVPLVELRFTELFTNELVEVEFVIVPLVTFIPATDKFDTERFVAVALVRVALEEVR
jgi:hypothetical protein